MNLSGSFFYTHISLMSLFFTWYNMGHMDMSQKEEVKALRGLLSNMEKGGKCIPCRIVFFFSFIVFVGVVVFVLIMQMEARKALTPVPPELAPQITPQQHEQELLRLEAVFKDPGSSLLSSDPFAPSSTSSAQTPSLPTQQK